MFRNICGHCKLLILQVLFKQIQYFVKNSPQLFFFRLVLNALFLAHAPVKQVVDQINCGIGEMIQIGYNFFIIPNFFLYKKQVRVLSQTGNRALQIMSDY